MSTAAVVLSFIGLFAGLHVLVAVVVVLNRVLRPLREIKRYADDTLAAVSAIGRNLDDEGEAARLHELAMSLPAGVRGVVG